MCVSVCVCMRARRGEVRGVARRHAVPLRVRICVTRVHDSTAKQVRRQDDAAHHATRVTLRNRERNNKHCSSSTARRVQSVHKALFLLKFNRSFAV